MRKNCSSDREKLLKFEAEGQDLKFFEITRTVYLSSERSEQCLVTECFSNLLLEVSHIQKIRTNIVQIGKNHWDLEKCRRS